MISNDSDDILGLCISGMLLVLAPLGWIGLRVVNEFVIIYVILLVEWKCYKNAG